MRLLASVLLLGCSDSDDGGPNDDVDHSGGDTDGTDGPTGDTDTDTSGGHTTPEPLEVSCAPTANALRFLCTVTVVPAQPVELTFVRADGLSATRTVEGTEVAAEHVLPLYFLAPEQTYDVTVAATASPTDVVTTTLTTTPAPAIVDSRLDITGTSTMGLIGTNLPCDNDAIGVVYDTNTGDLVWFQQFVPGGSFGPDDMISFTSDFTVLGESGGSIVEVDLSGADVVRLPNLSDDFGIPDAALFGNFHHDVMKRNETYYAIYQEDFGGNDVLDALVLFDGAGTELRRWHAMDHLDIPPNWSGDLLHTNAIYVDEAGDIYLSMLGQDMVAKLDGDLASPTFGDPVWLLDGRVGGELTGTLTTDFSAVSAPGYFSGEHSVILRADGRVQLLDNDNGRGLVITVDETANTATVDAEFATQENSCSVQGTSRSTMAGNPVVGCYGTTVREYDIATELLLWEATVECAGGPGPGAARFYPLDGW
jgi:hypothetical protein